jgi:hypothetical protein
MLVSNSHVPPTIEPPWCVKAPKATQQSTAVCGSGIEVYTVSRGNLSVYSTSEISVQCLTDLNMFFVAVESMFERPQSALLHRYFRLSLESDYPAS